MNPITKEIKLASGEIVSVGMNFYALSLMSQYPGGMGKLQKDMGDASKGIGKAMEAFQYVVWALIRAGGKVCTPEECAMSIGFDDIEPIVSVFMEFITESGKMSKNG